MSNRRSDQPTNRVHPIGTTMMMMMLMMMMIATIASPRLMYSQAVRALVLVVVLLIRPWARSLCVAC